MSLARTLKRNKKRHQQFGFELKDFPKSQGYRYFPQSDGSIAVIKIISEKDIDGKSGIGMGRVVAIVEANETIKN